MHQFLLTHEDLIDLLDDTSKWIAVVLDFLCKFRDAWSLALR